MISASFFALPGTVPCPAEALLLRLWSVLGCGGDGAVVVRRQVFNTFDGVEFAGFALKHFWCPEGQKGGRKTLCLRIVKLR